MSLAHVTMAPEELELLNELLIEKIGIHFPAQKSYILEGRLRPRLAALDLGTFKDYYLHLRLAGDDEFENLIALVTNHESFFFRELQPYRDLLDSDVLKSLSDAGAHRLLCAGCSSGEEAYSLRILSHEAREKLDRELRIDAFDIDERCIRLAQAAEYGDNSLRALEPSRIDRYFEMGSRHGFALKPVFRQKVEFWRANLLEPESYRGGAPYDVVSCRNVLIYFSEAARLRALAHLADCLRPGGLLILSVTESIMALSDRLEMTRLGSSIVYRRI